MSQRTGWAVTFLGVETHGSDLTWTFHITSADRETDVHLRTPTYGDIVLDVQTADGFYGGSGDDALDARLVERVGQLIVAHDTFRVLDTVRDRERRPAARWAA